MKNKILAFVFSFVASMSLSTAWAWDYSFKYDELYYQITNDTDSLRTVSVVNRDAEAGTLCYGCYHDYDHLTTIEVPEYVQHEGNLYKVTAIEYAAFAGADLLEDIKIPESVVRIGERAFWDCSLSSIVIPSSCKVIGALAFLDCEKLSSISIHYGVERIDWAAFSGCSSLIKTNFIGDIADWCNINFNDETANPIWYSRNLYVNDQEVVDLTIPNTIDTIKSNIFRNCFSIKSVTIPENVTYLANNAFEGTGLKHITWHPKNYNNGVPGNSSRSPFYYIKDSIQSITFGENVDTIPYRMCWEMYNLKSVSLPDNLKCIDYDAFSACKSLESIDIPNGVTYIGNYAFNECYSLSSITLPDSLRTIEQYAFSRCTLLTSITIPEKITTLSDCAFQDSGLDTIIWTPKNYDTGGNSPFYYVKDHIKSVIFTDNVEAIPSHMCWEMYNLQSVEIPNTVGTIRPCAFYGCSALTSVELPVGIRSMGDRMLCNCTALTSISIPDSVTFIGSDVFYNSGITSVVWNPKDYNNMGNSPFDPIKTNITSITFSDNVEAIPYRMCYNMSNLTDINGGKNVKRIGKEAFYGVPFEEGPIYIGRVLYGYSGTMPDNYSLTLRDNTIGIANNAFQNQQNLLMITFNEGLEEIGSEAFRNCHALLSLKFPNSLHTIGSSAFYDCYGLTVAKLGEGLQSIGEYAFCYCSALNTSVTFPETLQTIGRGVFEGCTNVPSITVQGTVERIEESTFRGCNQLKTIVLPNTVNYIGQYAFYDCYALKDFALPSSLTKIDYRAFENNYALNSLVLPNSVDTLCDRAFYNCDGLNSVQFGENLKYIGKESFCESNNLKSVTFNESLLNIDDRAFQSCGQLQAVQLNQKLQRIGHEAFRYCDNLRNVTFGDSLATIGERAFKRSGITSADLSKTQITNLPTRAFCECGSLVSVNFPKTLAEMGTECFSECRSLRLAELPQGMTTLPNHAFYGCTNLTSVHIPNSMVTIMNNVFQSCSNLLSVTLPENVLSVGAESFRYCSKLATLNLAMAQPISVGSNAFDGVTFSAINVPCGSKSTYMKDERWAVYDSIMHEVSLAPYNIIALPADGRRGVVDVQVPNACDGDAAYTLTVQPYYGYKFTQWNDGNTDNPRSVVLTQDTSFVATIERVSYEINAVPNFPERGKIEGSGSYLYLDTVTLTVTPNYGYYFDYWLDRQNYYYESDRRENPRKVIADKDTTYTAVLQKNQYTIQVEVTNPDLGAVNYPSEGYYLDTITMSSNVPVGYRIVEWGDGCTDDPRTFVLTQDTTFTATLGQAFNGKCGDDAYWAFSDSTLTINGSGDMYNYNSNNAPWQLLKEQIKNVVISAGITSIGRYAFYGCSSLAAVDIPKTVVNIYDYSFENCISLTSLIIPKSVTCIEGQSTFRNTGITSINWNARNYNDSYDGSPFYFIAGAIESFVFGDEVEVIPAQLCQGMSKLTQIVIPSTVDSIHSSAFYNCSGLTQVVFNEGLQYIGNSVFQNCSSLTNVVLPPTLETLGGNSFVGCSNLTTVQLPASMRSIGANAFASLKKLVSVTCKGNTKEITEPGLIGDQAFYDCYYLREMQIPEGIRAICYYSFGYNFALTSISLPTTLDSIGTHAFYGSRALQSVTIPAAVKHIEENALQDCGSLQLVQMLPAVPPTMIGSAISSSATIEVPCGTKEAYISNDAWSSYTNKLVEKSLSNYRVQVSAQDSISGVVNVQSPDCDSDGAYTITAQPNYGYKFTQWQDGNTDNPRKVVLTQDTTFVATMVRDGFLVQGVPNLPERGEVTGGTTALYGDTVTLTVTPNYGYYFDSWQDRVHYGDVNYRRENPRKVIAVKDTTYTAILQKNQYRVTVSATNPEYGTVSTSHGSAYYLDTIVLTANPILGYQLAQWNDGNTENPRRFVLTQDTTFTATFRQAYADRCGETAYWSYDNQGTLTITGSGAMYNYGPENAPWQLFRNSIKTIIISDSITRIGSYAFYNIKGITSLTIPTSLTQMGDYAISGCDSLTTLVWNARSLSVQNLGGLNASQLSSITFGNAVVDIPDNICNSMSQLKRLVLPASVKTIGYRSFYDCDSLVYVSIPLSVDSIGSEAFDACGGIDTIMYNAINLSKSTIGSLNRPSVSHVEFGSQVEYIPNDMCNGMTKLTKIVIPAKVKVIGNNAFRGCIGLELVEIPSTVDSIHSSAFYNCSGLTQVVFNEGLQYIGNSVFQNCSSLTNVVLPTTLETLGSSAFEGCSNLTTVQLPASMSSIGARAFASLKKLVSVTCVGDKKEITELGTIGAGAFYDCLGLQELQIPEGIRAIENAANGYNRTLKAISLPNSLDSLGSSVFYGCSSLKSITIPAAVKHIGENALQDCGALQVVQMLPATPPTMIGSAIFSSAIIEIPCDTKEAYISNDAWSSYTDKLVEKSLSNYRVQVSAQDPISGVVNVQSPDCDSDGAYTITAQPSYGYKFTQWQDGNTDNPRKVVLTQDTTFVATMVRDGFLVQGVPNLPERGEVTGGTTALYGDTVTLTVTPNYGYYFDSWQDRVHYGDVNYRRENPRKVIAVKDTTYTAVFQKNSYSISASVANNAEGNASVSSAQAQYLDTITVTAQPNYGFHFVAWNDSNTDNPRKVVLTQDTSFVATMARNTYTIQAVPNNEEWGMVEGGVTTLYGDTLTLTATPNYGYEFAYWSDDSSNKSNPRIVIVNGDNTYRAIFRKKQYSIAVNITNVEDGFGSISYPKSGYYLDTITMTGSLEVGYKISWSDGSIDNPRTFVLTQDTTFTATLGQAFDGKCGEDAYWAFHDTILTITGTGDMYNYSQNNAPWQLFKDTIKTIHISDDITYIGNNAFYNIKGITSITIPTQLKSLGNQAFRECTNLDTLVWNAIRLTNESNLGYLNAGYILHVEFGSQVEKIPAALCQSNNNLTKVIIPENVKIIGANAFRECNAMQTIDIPSSVDSIDSGAFLGCQGLIQLTLNEGLISIGADAFRGCQALVTVTLPNSLLNIGDRAFYECKSMTMAKFGTGLESLGTYAFRSCSALNVDITLPETLKTIGFGAFEYCSKLPAIMVQGSVERIEGSTFHDCFALQEISLPSTVKYVGRSAFCACRALDSIALPDSLTMIDNEAFYGCSILRSFVLPELLDTIGDKAFYDCDALTEIEFNDALIYIGNEAFRRSSNLKSVSLGESLQAIGNHAFYECGALREVKLNKKLSRVGNGIFSVSGLTSIDMSETQISYLSADMFNGCSALKTVLLPEKLLSIGQTAFYDCSSLKMVNIPSSVETIEHAAFAGCRTLSIVHLPKNIQVIPTSAFYGCNALTEITIPSQVISISSEAFRECSALVKLTVGAIIPPAIGADAFTQANLTQINVPCGAKSTYVANDLWAQYTDIIHEAALSNQDLVAIPMDVISGKVNVQAPDCDGDGAYTITAQPNYGYKFTQWQDGNTDNPRKVVLTQDTTFVATMVRDGFLVQGVPNLPERGEVTGGTTALYGDTVTLTVTPNYGYYFDYWLDRQNNRYENQKRENPRKVIADKDTTYTAVFQKNSYSISASVANSAEGKASVSKAQAQYLDTITVTAQPNYGFHFVAWNDGNTDNPRKVVLTQDTSFVATMARNTYTIQAVPNNEEWGMVEGGATTLYGDTLTLTATPNYGYEFAYWSDDSSNKSNPRTVIVNNDRIYRAIFQKKQYSITVNITNAEDGLGSISYPRSGYYLDTITMTGSLEVGYKISWSDGSIDDPRKFVLTQDTTFTATIGQAYDGKCGDDVYWAFHDTILTITGTGDMYNYSQNNAPWQLFKEEIKEIAIAEGITRIGNFAFYNIKGVTSIVIPESITSVGENALNNCSGLTTVVWNAKNCPTLNSNWIYRSSITSFTFGEQVEVIPSYVCYNLYDLSSIILPESVTSIGYSAFYGCSGISSLDIPAKVDSIAERAFYNCYGLDSLVVSCATKYIAANAFHANSLSTVTLKANSVEEYAQSNINKLLIDASVSATRKLLIGDEAPTDIIIPNTITRINYYAFWDVDGINSIIIPSSVTKIDSCAFYSDAICTISIPCTVDSIGGTAFMPSTLENLIITTTNLEQFLQSDINLLLNASNANTVPRTLWVNGAEVTNVLIPNSITEIKERAFYRMANITSVNMPEGVIKLGSYAFAGCNKLEVVKLPNSLDTIPVRAFDQCSLLATVDLGDSIKRIDDYAFASCFRLLTLRMPEALKSIGSYVFSSCSNLTSIHLPMLVPPTIISNKTFYGATKLSSFYVPCGAKDNYTSDANWSSFASKINERYFTDYTITTASTNDAWGIVTLNEPTSCADTTYNVVAKPYEGYHFVQWQDGNIENPRTIALTQDTAFTAEFARNTYTISTRPNIVDRGVTSEAQSALYMDSVEIAAVAKYGYHFTQWNDGNTDNPRKVVVTEDRTYQAQFDKNRYAVHANCDDELGAITYPDSVEYLDVIELEVDPIFGYHFVQWQDGNTDNPRRVQITQDTTFTAYCAINEYAISVIANYEERGTTEGSGTYRHGDSITMSATANYGYHFIRWQDSEEVDISKDAIYSTIVTKQIDYVAIFGKNVYQITTESTDNTKGHVDAVTHAEYLDEVILTAVPEVGYYFTQWNDGNTDNPRTIILTQDTAFAASFEIATSGSCGEDAFWSYQDGHLSISGQNDMYDYLDYSSTPWMLYREQIKSVSIADGVTRIGSNAFSNCTNLETIEIPNSVREIAAMAFANCGKLTTFTVPEQTIHIDADVFTGCAGITSITWNAISYQDSQKASTSPLKPLSEQITTFTVGEKVKYIPANLLPAMPALNTVNWNAIAGDDYYAHNNTPFYTNRDQIKVFTIGDNVEYIPEYLCYNLNAITAVQLPNTVTSVGAYAFAECSKLKDIAMGTALKVIGYRAFANCESIVELHIGESVETIDRYAFYNCNAVTKISIGSHVNWIGDHAFDNCTQVEEIYCYAPNPPTAERRTFYSYTPILRVSYTAGALYRSDSIFGLFNTIGYYDNTGVEDLVIDGITITNGTIHCNEPFTIYDLLGNNVTASNGSLQGVYIVRTASAAQKVVLNSNINL